MNKKIIWENPNINFNAFNSDFEEKDTDHENEIVDMVMPEPNKLFYTPFGLFEINDPFSPMKRTELRLGNTNFPITPEIAEQINDCEGVDALRVLSRYSFIIGVAKSFDFSSVRRIIEKTLGCLEEVQQVPDNVKELISDISHKKYIIFIFPNGNFEWVTSDDQDFEEALITFKELKKITDGTIIKNH